MQMELLSGFKTMMHNTFCTLINNKWLFLSRHCLDHWESFLVVAKKDEHDSFNIYIFEKITFLLFKIFQNICI